MSPDRELFHRDEHWFMLRSQAQLAHFDEQPWAPLRPRAFLADDIPAALDRAAVRALCLEDVFAGESERLDIPAALHAFPQLAYLQLPRKYVPALRQGEIPPSVRALDVAGEGPARFPTQLSLPHVSQLAGIPAALTFSKATFPRLRHLTLRFDRRRGMLPLLAELTDLRSLACSPTPDGAVFAAAPPQLTALTLGGGTLRTLDGIERLQELTSVRLTNLDRLENIAALARLPRLAEVSLSWCARLARYDVLLERPRLEQLTIFGCRSFDAKRYGPLLQARQLRQLSYPDQTRT